MPFQQGAVRLYSTELIWDNCGGGEGLSFAKGEPWGLLRLLKESLKPAVIWEKER